MSDKLTVDVFCKNSESKPQYRLYLDQDLLTERTFKWVHTERYISEQCGVNLTPGVHKIWIDGPDCELFELKNAVVNGQSVDLDAQGQFEK